MSITELKITDTQEGTGKAAVKGALLLCHYTGYLEDGTKFDSSYDHGRPFQFFHVEMLEVRPREE